MTISLNSIGRGAAAGGPTNGKPTSAGTAGEKGDGFKGLLQAKLTKPLEAAGALSFSQHAQNRLDDRDIKLSQEELSRLERATEKAAKKGARTGLMMMGNLNLIVSIQNRTVVTAMEQAAGSDAVYTNIDTAVVIGDDT